MACIVMSICEMTEEEQDMAYNMMKSCEESEGAKEEDMKNMLKGEFSEDPKFKCAIACVHESFSIVSCKIESRLSLTIMLLYMLTANI